MDKVGIIHYSPTHVHLVYKKGEQWVEECALLEAGYNYICTAPPPAFRGDTPIVDEWKYVRNAEEYVNRFFRRVNKARERGLLPASWRWIQTHIKL